MTPENPSSLLTRRGFMKVSGAAIGALSLATLVPSVMAKSSTVDGRIPANMVIPTKESPIRVQFNENALGMSPKAQQAAIKAIPMANRYPFNDVPQLRSLVAARHKVQDANILFTPGSSDAIRACIAAYTTPDTQFVCPDLTYADGVLYAGYYKLKMAAIPSSREDWSMDLAGMQKAVADHSGPSIVYLVNPNNPTSTVIPSDTIEKWIQSRPANTIFILDEAYAEFVNNAAYRSADALVAQGQDNVLVLRTFSKIHAMAGMRMGYVVATSDRLDHIKQYVEEDAMTISYPGVMAGIASIQDTEFLEISKKSNDMSRGIMLEVLDELKLACLPSETNFLFHKIPVSLADYQKAMRERHIIVGRAFPPAEGWCRLSLGTPGEMLFVAKTMRELRGKGLV